MAKSFVKPKVRYRCWFYCYSALIFLENKVSELHRPGDREEKRGNNLSHSFLLGIEVKVRSQIHLSLSSAVEEGKPGSLVPGTRSSRGSQAAWHEGTLLPVKEGGYTGRGHGPKQRRMSVCLFLLVILHNCLHSHIGLLLEDRAGMGSCLSCTDPRVAYPRWPGEH